MHALDHKQKLQKLGSCFFFFLLLLAKRKALHSWNPHHTELPEPLGNKSKSRSITPHLPLPWIFHDQFINSPVFITRKIHRNIKENEIYHIHAPPKKAAPTDDNTLQIIVLSSQLQAFTISGDKINQKLQNKLLPSIWQVATDGEWYLPLTKLLHCNLKKVWQNKISLIAHSHKYKRITAKIKYFTLLIKNQMISRVIMVTPHRKLHFHPPIEVGLDWLNTCR